MSEFCLIDELVDKIKEGKVTFDEENIFDKWLMMGLYMYYKSNLEPFEKYHVKRFAEEIIGVDPE